MTPEERQKLEAQMAADDVEKAKIAKDKKDLDAKGGDALTAQIDELLKIVADQKAELALKGNSDAAAIALAAKKVADDKNAALKKEADIKKMVADKSKKGDYDDLTPTEILAVVADAVDSAMAANTSLATADIEKPMAKLNKDIADIKQYLVNTKAEKEIKQAQLEFPDFDKYKDEIMKIFAETPGITPEDAYILAKGRASKGSVIASEIETEKPDSLTSRALAAEKAYADKKEKERGLSTENAVRVSRHRKFGAALSDAIDTVRSTRQ